MNANSQFVTYNPLFTPTTPSMPLQAGLNDGLGIDPVTVGTIITVGSQVLPAIFGGNTNAKRRNQKRAALQQVGFNWVKSSGSEPASEMWNIDNWDADASQDISLDNIARAYSEFGPIVAELHNQKVFTPQNTKNYDQIKQIIMQHMPPTQAALIPGDMLGSNLGMGLVIGAGVLGTGTMLWKLSQKKSKR